MPTTHPASSASPRPAGRLWRASQRLRHRVASPGARRLASELRRQHLTYLKPDALLDLRQRVREAERRGIPGELIEAGAARGGSTIMIAASKAKERPLRVFDTFALIPPPSARDGEDVHERYRVIESGTASGPGGSTYYGYEPDLLEQVKASFSVHGIEPREHNVQFVRGLFEDTLEVDGPVAFAHLDCDWYESVITCLERIGPKLQTGGAFVIDDYYTWSGCRAAVDEYFQDKRDRFLFQHRSRLHVVRRADP